MDIYELIQTHRNKYNKIIRFNLVALIVTTFSGLVTPIVLSLVSDMDMESISFITIGVLCILFVVDLVVNGIVLNLER